MTKCPQVIAIVKNAKSVQLTREQLDDLPILDGACCSDPNVDPDLWFPDQGQSIFEAKAICSTCPAFNECLTFANGAHELGWHLGRSYGIRAHLPAGIRRLATRRK